MEKINSFCRFVNTNGLEFKFVFSLYEVDTNGVKKMAKKKSTKATKAAKDAEKEEIEETDGEMNEVMESVEEIDMDDFFGEDGEFLNEDLEVIEDFDDGLDHVSIKELDDDEIVETKIKKTVKAKKATATEKAIEAAKEVADSLVQDNLEH